MTAQAHRMKIAILTFDGFNELDTFIALGLVNRLHHLGWAAAVTSPTAQVTSMNGVTVTAQQPLEFANEADVVLFGSGIHTCFGGPLARLEINVALEIFLKRVRSPRLVVDPPPYRRNQVFRGPRHLWVDFASIDD